MVAMFAKPHIVAENLILPVGKAMVITILGEKATKDLLFYNRVKN